MGSVNVGIVEAVLGSLKSALTNREKVEIMIAEHRSNRCVEMLDESQRRERLGAPVDQVADEPEPIIPWIEGNPVEQEPERLKTTLDIADRVSGHETV